MSKKSDLRKAIEWLKQFDPSEIKEAVEFANGFEQQLREKLHMSETVPYVWTEQQRNDLVELRKMWLQLAARFDARARSERSPYHKLLLAGSMAALEGVSETLMELIDDHLV